MFTNFLKVTLRTLCREKIYAAINLIGLSIAIACCLIIGLYLRGELTYDMHNKKHKQIYRVETEPTINGRAVQAAYTSQYLGPMLKEYSEVKDFVRFKGMSSGLLIRHEDKVFYWDDIYSADKNVFDVFTHNIIYGDPETALVNPDSMAVSESFAKKYFGESDPVGKTIDLDGTSTKITLVFKDLPENSHLKYNALTYYDDRMAPGPFSGKDNPRRLWLMFVYTYLVMPEGYNARDFKKVSDSFFEQNMKEFGKKAYNGSWRCWLQPLADVHYKSKVTDACPSGNIFYIYGFAAVAIFIILVACINYMNLATARAAKRTKEVGMRKILGSGRTRLMLQFTVESVFFSFTAMLLGYAIVELALNLTPINELLGKSLTLDISHEPGMLLWMLIFSLAVGLMSGIYPALYLSSILPFSSTVTSSKSGGKSVRLRGALVLIQFTISVCVIACTILMFLQMRYMSNKSLGFNKENVLIIPMRGADIIEKTPVIKKELLKNSSILGMALSDSKLLIGASFAPMVDNKENILERFTVSWTIVGNDFIDVMGMQLIEGKDFSDISTQANGTFAYIVNEAAVKKMGWEQPLGKRIQPTGGDRNGKIVGIVKDFNHQSLKIGINPLIMGLFSGISQNQPREKATGFLYMKIQGKDIPGTINFLKEKFNEFDPKHPFEFEFLSDNLNNLYLSEQHLMKLTGVFAAVCILISCLGLFGLVAFSTEQRGKEIAVRKVLGATVLQIIAMLSKNILLLVSGGAIVASLIAYYTIDEWLSGFAYRTNIEIWVFFVSAFLAAAVAFITVALQSFKTAQADPVKALRYE